MILLLILAMHWESLNLDYSIEFNHQTLKLICLHTTTIFSWTWPPGYYNNLASAFLPVCWLLTWCVCLPSCAKEQVARDYNWYVIGCVRDPDLITFCKLWLFSIIYIYIYIHYIYIHYFYAPWKGLIVFPIFLPGSTILFLLIYLV